MRHPLQGVKGENSTSRLLLWQSTDGSLLDVSKVLKRYVHMRSHELSILQLSAVHTFLWTGRPRGRLLYLGGPFGMFSFSFL